MRKIINLFIACYRNVKHSISTFLLKRRKHPTPILAV